MNDNKLSPRELGVDTAPFKGPAALVTTMLDLGLSLAQLGMNPSLKERSDEAVRQLLDRGIMPPPTTLDAMDAAIARINRGVKVTIETIDAPYVGELVARPHLLTGIVYGPRETSVWPPEGKTPARVLADCREKQRALVGTGAADMVKVHQLRRAAAAIERLIAEEG